MQKFFFKKCLFAYEIRFAVEKKTKNFSAKFSKLLCVAIKKMAELYDKRFFQKTKTSFFFTRLFY